MGMKPTPAGDAVTSHVADANNHPDCALAYSEPDTSASPHGGDAPTTIHETAAVPEAALAYSDALELPEPRRSRVPVVLFAVAALALAGAVAAWFLVRSSSPPAAAPGVEARADQGRAAPGSPPAPSSSVSPAAAPTTTAPEPPDRFVAMAVSPRSGANARGGYGVSGTQARADELAISECKAVTGDDLCLVVAKSRNGCAAYAADAYGKLAGGSGLSADSAEVDALAQLPDGHIVDSHCSKHSVE
jgi:Domain of unknown function (DUF4189)